MAEDDIFAKPCVVSSFELENLCIHVLKAVNTRLVRAIHKEALTESVHSTIAGHLHH